MAFRCHCVVVTQQPGSDLVRVLQSTYPSTMNSGWNTEDVQHSSTIDDINDVVNMPLYPSACWVRSHLLCCVAHAVMVCLVRLVYAVRLLLAAAASGQPGPRHARGLAGSNESLVMTRTAVLQGALVGIAVDMPLRGNSMQSSALMESGVHKGVVTVDTCGTFSPQTAADLLVTVDTDWRRVAQAGADDETATSFGPDEVHSSRHSHRGTPPASALSAAPVYAYSATPVSVYSSTPAVAYSAARAPVEGGPGPSVAQNGGNYLCVMCKQNKRTVGFIHRGSMHVCACMQCAQKWFEAHHTCPVCKVVADMMPVLASEAMPAPAQEPPDIKPPGKDASKNEKMDFLHHQLDSLGTQTPILDGLVLLGSGGYERLQGGALQ